MPGHYGGQPAYIVNPRTEHKQGRDALSVNIAAAKAVANIVKTTLGPKGMDKMMVNSIGDIVITNDGAMILKGMDIEHPTAKMIVEVARTQEEIAGDGTTSAVVTAGTLLDKASDLIEEGVHARVLVRGFENASEKALEILNEFAIDVSEGNREVLEKIASTSMSGKASETNKEILASLCVDAILQISKKGSVNVDNDIILRQEPGKSVDETEILDGIMLNKYRVHPGMPKTVKDAKIAIIDTPLETQKTSNTSKLQISNADEMQNFLAREDDDFKQMADHVIKSGANVVICSKNIGDKVAHYLQKSGVMGIRRVSDDDIRNLSYATGAKIVKRVFDLSEEDLGHAGEVGEEGESTVAKIFIKKCENTKVITILLRGSTEHVTDNLERAFDDALHVINSVFEDGKIVAGGGAAEVEIAQRLRHYASSIGGREQLAITAFADAVESIPMAIAENGGMDATSVILKLRNAHIENPNIGLDIYSGDYLDMVEKGIVDPLRVKTQTIRSASEVATMILRIDDMMRAQKKDMMDVNPEHNIHNYNRPF